jgi:OOP family OmpA-OmpF porin
MNRNFGKIGTIAALLVGSSAINAQTEALPGTIEIPSGNPGYVNAEGNAVRTGLGECLKLDDFSEDTQVNSCEGIEESADSKGLDGEGDADGESAEADSAASEAAAPAPEPIEKEPIVTTATLGGEALFDSGSAELNSASEQALAELVSELEKFQEITSIQVTGHSDSTGDDAFNQSLSEQRAAAVEAYIKAAYPNVDVSSNGLGESSPVATNSTAEGRALNRRVEVQITAKSITE